MRPMEFFYFLFGNIYLYYVMYCFPAIMYKKIALLVCCLAPLLFVFFVGYPVKPFRETKRDGFVLSKRCFKVGELSQFVECFSSGKALSHNRLISHLGDRLDSLFPKFNMIFFSSLILLVLVVSSFIFLP